MDNQLLVVVVSAAGVVLASLGAWFGAALARKSAKESTAAQIAANQSSNEQLMIDQLQEELAGYRREAVEAGRLAAERATAQDERMNRLERYSDGYRSHAHELRSWIWDGRQPPPPPWPEGLPK